MRVASKDDKTMDSSVTPAPAAGSQPAVKPADAKPASQTLRLSLLTHWVTHKARSGEADP
jgi:hypothetical protein